MGRDDAKTQSGLSTHVVRSSQETDNKLGLDGSSLLVRDAPWQFNSFLGRLLPYISWQTTPNKSWDADRSYFLLIQIKFICERKYLSSPAKRVCIFWFTFLIRVHCWITRTVSRWTVSHSWKALIRWSNFMLHFRKMELASVLPLLCFQSILPAGIACRFRFHTECNGRATTPMTKLETTWDLNQDRVITVAQKEDGRRSALSWPSLFGQREKLFFYCACIIWPYSCSFQWQHTALDKYGPENK